MGWLLAVPSAALLLTGPVAVLTRPDPDPYAVGLVFGRLAGPLLVGFAVRGLYKAASRARPRPRLLSPWVLVVAGLVFLLLAVGRIGDELATRARAEQLRAIPPARYLTLSAPYESVRLPASEETAVRDQVARTLADAQASEFEVRIVRREGQELAVAFAFRVQPTTAAEEDFWPGVVTGLEQGAGKENVARTTLEGRPAAVARMTDQTLVMWQDGAVVAGIAAPGRETAEAVARAVISANAETRP